MVDLLFSVGRLLVALFLVGLNGFFVAAEFAYVRIRPTTVERLVEEGRRGADSLDAAVGALDDYLAVTQLGITIASLGLGWAGEPAIVALIEPALAPVLPEGVVHLVGFAIGFSIVTYLHVVFGELAPKTIAIARVERIALLVAPPMRAFYYLFYPGLVAFNGTANFFTRLIGVPPASESDETLTEEEILMVLSRAGREGKVDASEVEMIERVFRLDDTTAREVMVPRVDVASVPPTMPLAELRRYVIEEERTRYPVVDDDEEVVGFVDVKDVIRATESVDGEGTTAADLARELPIVPESARIDDLLERFQDREVQMAAVIDEFGAFEGVVTVEDVVEVVVGDIRDQFDVPEREPSIDRRPDGTLGVDGAVPIAELETAVNADIEAEAVGTVGGLVLDRLGRIPSVGDAVAVGDFRLVVDDLDGVRIESVTVRPADEGGTDDRPAEGGSDGTAEDGDRSDDDGTDGDDRSNG